MGELYMAEGSERPKSYITSLLGACRLASITQQAQQPAKGPTSRKTLNPIIQSAGTLNPKPYTQPLPCTPIIRRPYP